MGDPSWMELEIGFRGAEVEITVRSDLGQQPAPATLEPSVTLERLQQFAKLVGRAVRAAQPLDAAVVKEAWALHAAVFQGSAGQVASTLATLRRSAPVLHRLMLRDPSLQAVPWEALCKPNTSEGFWGTSPTTILARGVWSADVWQPLDVLGAVRVLVVAPFGAESSLIGLRQVLAESIGDGEIEWLEPITGGSAGERTVFENLQRSKNPHVLHFIGHGGVNAEGHPVLRLADDEDGNEVWLKAELLATALRASFQEELRLVVLECCEGAKAGLLGSAAEQFVKAGADAAIAHLWPIKAKAAQACSRAFYRALTGVGRAVGDVGASLATARGTLASGSAERFSPVLYVRGRGTALFDFEDRRVVKPTGGGAPASALAPALAGLLEKPFSMVLGDDGDDRRALRVQIEKFLRENEDRAPLEKLSLDALTQRLALRFGKSQLHLLFQSSLGGNHPIPPLVDALARLLQPGVHATLLWLPVLEHALARRQPGRNVYVVQPSLLEPGSLPGVYKRGLEHTQWTSGPKLLSEINFNEDLVVLRLYGGYLASTSNQFTAPMLTEDDHVYGLIGGERLAPPNWATPAIANLKLRPALLTGISLLELKHRMLLHWLYGERPPAESVALLRPDGDPAEQDIWQSGRGLRGAGRIAAVVEDPNTLARALEALSLEALSPRAPAQ